MADDTYTTLLEFITETTDANRGIEETTKNLKKMEEQSKKVLQPKTPLDTDQFKNYVTAFSKSNAKVVEEARKLGINVRKGILEELDAQGMFSAVGEEFGKLVTEVERGKRRITEEKASLVVPPSASAEKLSRINPSILESVKELEAEAERTGTTFTKSFGQLIEAGYDAEQAVKRLSSEIVKTRKETEKNAKNEALYDKEAVNASRARAQLYSKESSVLRKLAGDIRENAQILRNQAQQLQSISQTGLAVGTGVVGGIFAFASKYVRDAEEATTVTIAWKRAQDDLGKSGQRIGAVLAQEALPLLRLAAKTAQEAAGFIERHPELVQAALNIGLITAGLGAVGTAVSKGIKLYADQLYLQSIPLQLRAGELQLLAAREQLAAAKLKQGLGADDLVSGGSPVPGVGNIGSTLGKVTLVAASVIIGAEVGLAIANKLGEKIFGERKGTLAGEGNFGLGDAAVGVIMAFQTPAYLLVKTLNELNLVSDENVQKFRELLTGIDRFAAELLGAERILNVLNNVGKQNTSGERGTIGGRRGEADSVRYASKEIRDRAAELYRDYKADDLRMVEEHYAEREKITQDGLKAEQRENEQYRTNAARIRTQGSRAVSEATRNFELESRRAEEQLAQERGRIVRDGGIEIARIEEESQERLRKMREEHEFRLEGLIASRDALGIVKEQRRYAQERNEELRSTNREVQQRRADLALRLQDLQQNYQIERAQRLEDFQLRIEEIKNNTKEQLAELTARHRAEVSQIRQNTVERIKELDNQFKTERARRYQQFIESLRQLDASLLGESALRKQRQQEMLQDLDNFLMQYRSRLSTIGGTSTANTGRTPAPSSSRNGNPGGWYTYQAHARGGYAEYGLHLLGDRIGGGRGRPEFVLDGSTTEMAERVLGGKLSQQKFATLLAAMNGGSNRSITYNDSRRIDSRISNTERQRLANDALSALEQALQE